MCLGKCAALLQSVAFQPELSRVRLLTTAPLWSHNSPPDYRTLPHTLTLRPFCRAIRIIVVDNVRTLLMILFPLPGQHKKTKFLRSLFILFIWCSEPQTWSCFSCFVSWFHLPDDLCSLSCVTLILLPYICHMYTLPLYVEVVMLHNNQMWPSYLDQT